jgi:diguanylate cyclase (GGDEF)-like protein
MKTNRIVEITSSFSEFRKYYLSILFLGIYSYLSLPLLFQSGQQVSALFISCGLFLLFINLVMLLSRKTLWLSNAFLMVLLCLVFANSFAQPYIPFELFLFIPIYQLMIRKFRPVYFWGLLFLDCLLILVVQSGIFFPEIVVSQSNLLPYRWLISMFAICPVAVIFLSKKTGIESLQIQENSFFNSLEAYIHAIDSVDMGLWSWETLNNQFNLSRQCGILLAINEKADSSVFSFQGTSPFLHAIHTEDREIVNKALIDIANGKIDEFDLNVRIVSKCDDLVWLRIRARRHIGESISPVTVSGTITDITQHIQFERKSHFFEAFDPLTNLPNKKTISEQINVMIEKQADDVENNFGVMIINIDRFNAINESLGRAIGDDLLKAFAQRLEKCMRMVDGIARLSEDTFIILVSSVNSFQKIYIVADRIQEKIQMPFWIQRNEIYITASIGIALYHPEICSAEEILHEAEIAMFNAKSKGKALHALYKPEMLEIVNKRHQIELDLRKAIDNNEFELYYQPIVSLTSDVISGLEALIRWHHPIQGLISPSDFIPIAEESGLIIPIGDWVLETACKKISEIRDQNSGLSSLTMSINLAAPQLIDNLVDKIRDLLIYYHISGSNLILEITETTVMTQSETVSRLITELRSLKVRLHIDDFGTGYSSFKYLQNFPVDSIKIDRTFISQLENSHNNYEIVRTVVNLAHELGMTAIAEGVETSYQQELLRQFGCESIQGYLISKPIPNEKLLEYLMQGSCATVCLDEIKIE